MRGGRERRFGRAAAAVALLALGACVIGRPVGLLGARWGDPAAAAAEELGVRCESWQEWEGGAGFQMCDAGETSVLFGTPGRLRLIRRDGRLAGAQVEYAACRPELREALAEELGVAVDEAQPYQRWESGEVVRLAVYEDGACTLTLTGPELGTEYAAWVLRRGLDRLSTGMRP